MKITNNHFGRKLLAFLLCAGLMTSCYDDSDVLEQLKNQQSQIDALKTLCAQQNTNLEALQTIVSALQEKDYVTGVAPIKEGETIIGYTITFSKSGVVTIYNGKDGYVPVVGVKQDESDGQWYWTIDGEWMTDSDGDKVCASAKDGEDGADGSDGAQGESGITPKLKIEDGYWYVSYDGGETWESEPLGQATGEQGYTMFKKVEYDDKYLYITMADGEELTLPRTAEDLGDEEPETGGEGETNDAITNTSGGVTLSVALRSLTETGVAFYGEAQLAENYTANSFGILYSDQETFTAATAQNIPIVDIYGTSYSVSTSSLKPGTTYYYTSYIKQGDLYKYGEIKSFTTVSLVAPTLDAASGVTEVSSTISGTVSLASGTASDLEYGFQYCTSEDFSSGVVSSKITDIDSENKFSMQITSLVPMTSYYYRSYIKMNGVYGYGEIKSFTTVSLVAPTLDAASGVTATKSTVSGVITMPSETTSDLHFGVLYSTSSPLSYRESNRVSVDILTDNTFTTTISGLSYGTIYYFCSYVSMNGKVVLGEEKTFETLPNPYTVQSDLNMSSATDLSSSASANCYIVSESGLYKFKAVKGNGSESVGSVASSAILWETFGTSTAPDFCELIDEICYKDCYIAFQTADTFKEGNALIAAKDADGTILWSWHIWFTDQPQGQTYYNSAGTMMDRNLGATSATPGNVGALGLLYQWGRKDPFLGSSSISSSTLAKSTITWPSSVSSNSSNGTIEYATAHPTTFITYNSSNYDWYYTGSSSTDNTRWTTSGSDKSIYDPCPAGWRVPDGGSSGVWSSALGSSSSYTGTYNSTNEGMNFSSKFGSASTIWYPASGCRNYGDGALNDVGDYGDYWSASPNGYNAYSLYFSGNGYVYPSNYYHRARGFSVRCLQE